MKLAFPTLLILASLSVALSPRAFAAQKRIDCASPARLAGGTSSVRGLLNLTRQPNGQFHVEGELAVEIQADGKTLYSSKMLKVQGIYDKLSGLEYAYVGPAGVSRVTGIYINFSRRDQSNVEYLGVSYLLNCAK